MSIQNEERLYKWNFDVEKLKIKNLECMDVSKNFIALATKNGQIYLHSSISLNKLLFIPSTEFGTEKPPSIKNILFSKEENYLGVITKERGVNYY
jgi:hypothetical protein